MILDGLFVISGQSVDILLIELAREAEILLNSKSVA
jgi:hypothetical protein